MEIMMPLPVGGADFNFNSTCTSPMGSTPTSPHGGCENYFFSAPTSPTSSFMFHHQISFAFASPATQNPVDWEDNTLETPENFEEEENPDINENSEEMFTNRNNSEEEENPENHEDSEELFTNSNNSEEEEGDSNMDFAFDFSGQLELTPSLPADELFDGGKIKPLEPQPKKILRNALSFRKKKKYSDPCVQAVSEVRCDGNYRYEGREHRGRERVYESGPNSTRRQKGSKSLSPLRNFNMVSEQISFSPLRNTKMVSEPKLVLNNDHNLKQISPSLATSSTSGSGWYGKWKLTNLLFRSASEGHQTIKIHDYSKKTQLEDVRNSSFPSTERSGSGSYGGRKKETVPVYERHYKANRTASGDMMPYKQNLMGCMASDAVVFEPSGKRVISNSQAGTRQY